MLRLKDPRITACIVLLAFVTTAATITQVDWNTQIKNRPAAFTGGGNCAVTGQIVGALNSNGTLTCTSTINNAVVLTIRLTPQPFASLPSCVSGTQGTMASVIDSIPSTFGSTIVGGGPNNVVAFCNGTNWVVD